MIPGTTEGIDGLGTAKTGVGMSRESEDILSWLIGLCERGEWLIAVALASWKGEKLLL